MINPQRLWLTTRPYLLTLALTAAMVWLLHTLNWASELSNATLLLLLPVLGAAVLQGVGPAFGAAVLGVLALNFFFVTPMLSFKIADLRDLITFGVYLTVAGLTASLASRLKRRAVEAQQQELQMTALYGLSRSLADSPDLPAAARVFGSQVAEAFGMQVGLYLTDESQRLSLLDLAADSLHAEEELLAAEQAYERRAVSKLRVSAGSRGNTYFVPLRAENRYIGVIALYPATGKELISPLQVGLVETLGSLMASTIVRLQLAEEARVAQVSAESERLRTAILNSVSHELRTPLAAIIGSAGGLLEHEALFSPEDRRELLLTIRDGAQRMNRLVFNLLSMAQLESGMLSLRRNWCGIEDLIGMTLAQLKDEHRHRRLQVDIRSEQPLVVPGDEVLLEQMLRHVVSNAIKYSPEDSEIQLMVEASQREVVIRVADEGMGIAEQEREKIFGKFYRAEATRHLPGTGLGLAISRGIAELHGGTISASARVPIGTVITLTLPLAEHTEAAASNGKGGLDHHE
ncbi:ATP-binding protein [Paenibacillus daejeonensis]|uniref:ATP-binding protein n=1 Tax=Paenibacillus daejeonensis TaxID=135193 RepID=UPI00036C3BE0|nr:ATP-binding protein [Paenibacillus daejeonensis]